MKKVGIVINELTLGGAEAQAVLIARAIKQSQTHKPIIFGLVQGGALEVLLEKENIEYSVLNFNFNLFFKNKIKKTIQIFKLVTAFKKQKLDVVISLTIYPCIVCGISAFFLPKTKFYWYQVGREWSVPITSAQKIAMSVTKKYLANSNEIKRYLIERLRINSEYIKVIPNVFFKRNIEFTKEYWMSKLRINSCDIVVALVSNFFVSKDQMTALRAMLITKQKYPFAKLILVGFPPEPNYLNQLKAFVLDHRLYENVVFCESTSDVFGLLSVAHIGLFTSIEKHTEGSPTIIQEYMYAGLPVVASRIGCIEELFEGLDQSYLYVPENEVDLADKLDFFLGNEQLRSSVGAFNKLKAESDFKLDNLRCHIDKLLSSN